MLDFATSPFGSWLAGAFAGIFSRPSEASFLVLACGWALSCGRHTVANYLWLSGAVAFKHFTRYYGFLGTTLYRKRRALWRRVIRAAALHVPEDQEIIILIDDSTKKKAGRTIEGTGWFRNSAASARQEYRTVNGLNFISAVMVIESPLWPGSRLCIPVGLELYLQRETAERLGRPYFSRGELARKIVEWVAELLPDRHIRVIADGGYATRAFAHDRVDSVHITSRLLVTAALYESPPATQNGRGRPRKKGRKIGSPKTLARNHRGWRPHPDPDEKGTEIQAFDALWYSVTGQELIRCVVVRRSTYTQNSRARTRAPQKEVEAFFSTDTTLTAEEILEQYALRWAIEIDFRDAYAYSGLGQDQCRKYERIVGINALRQVLSAMRTLWFIEQAQAGHVGELRRWRPWYVTKTRPSQLDVLWVLREQLHAWRISPVLRFLSGQAENHSSQPTAHAHADAPVA